MAMTVLVVEDSVTTRTLVVNDLRAVGFFEHYYEAGDGAEALRIMESAAVDMVVCDLIMPRMDGIEFLSRVKNSLELQNVPVIMMSERGEPALKIRALGSGACDYMTKPVDAGELMARIFVHLNIKVLQEDMRKANQFLKELSVTDHLTHLHNRRYMMESLERECQRALRRGEELSLILLDIDHFKSVNDTYGHQCGDLVLAALAEAVQVELRAYDIAARYGGEEFAVILPETPLAAGADVAERLRRIAQGIKFPPPMESLTLTVSQGVAALPAPGIESADLLIKMADEALYRAKLNGRNRVETMGLP